MNGNNPAIVACKDILEHYRSLGESPHGRYGTFIVSGEYLYNKEQRKLNKALGISGINKLKNTNRSKK